MENPEQLARDEEMARQLQQQEFRNIMPQNIVPADNPPRDIGAPLLNDDNQPNDRVLSSPFFVKHSILLFPPPAAGSQWRTRSHSKERNR